MMEATLAGNRTGAPDREGYFPIRTSSLTIDTITGFDLYLWSGPTRPMVLYREKSAPFTEDIRARLHESAVAYVHVSNSQLSEYRQYVEQNLASILADPNTPMAEKSEVLYSASVGLVKDLFADPRAEGIIKRSQAIVENTVQFMFSHSHAFANLLRVTSFDYYTYTHSVNVFVFTVALAKHLGHRETAVLQMGNGALLHDIGKADIDPAIVNCRGKLTPAQWTVMKRHPIYGQRILEEQGVRDSITLDVTRHHHEKLDGSGYPDGLKLEDVSIHPRICAVADIFDALTTKRSYKDALSSFAALRLIKEEMSPGLDSKVFRGFVELMGNATDLGAKAAP